MSDNGIIREENIRVQVEAEGWAAAIRGAGELLLRAGSITSAYIDAMVAAVTDMGPYMVIMPGFALAHAAPSEAVLRNDSSLISLKSPVNFGSDNDPVHIVLCVSCTGRDSHRASLRRIAQMIVDDGVLESFIQARSVNEIMEIIKQY